MRTKFSLRSWFTFFLATQQFTDPREEQLSEFSVLLLHKYGAEGLHNDISYSVDPGVRTNKPRALASTKCLCESARSLLGLSIAITDSQYNPSCHYVASIEGPLLLVRERGSNLDGNR